MRGQKRVRSREYVSWLNMIQRCTNPRNPRWKDWGGRGITVCERWLDFAAFAQDMGPRPEGTTMERIDNDRGYEPGNCRWATPAEQAANRRPKRSYKITREQAQEIRQDQRPLVEIAAQYDLNVDHVRAIRRGAHWAPEPDMVRG